MRLIDRRETQLQALAVSWFGPERVLSRADVNSGRSSPNRRRVAHGGTVSADGMRGIDRHDQLGYGLPLLTTGTAKTGYRLVRPSGSSARGRRETCWATERANTTTQSVNATTGASPLVNGPIASTDSPNATTPTAVTVA